MQQYTITSVESEDIWQSSHGPMRGQTLWVADAAGNQLHIAVNSKPASAAYTQGETIWGESKGTQAPSGAQNFKVSRRPPQDGGYGGAQAPQAPPAGYSPPPGQAPSQPSSVAMPWDRAVALMQAASAALGVTPESGQATTLFLGVIRGDIQAPQAPAPQGNQPPPPSDEDGPIPF